jgi:glycosyltransferase involved in cell wall biosynthesis
MKVLYFTPIPSPFQIEFVNEINKISVGFQVVLVFSKPATEERAHWNAFFDGIILKDKSLKTINELLKNEKPDILVFAEYNTLFGNYLRYWSIKNKVDYFVGTKEMCLNAGIIKSLVRKFMFSLFSKKSNGVIAIGRQALLQFEKLYTGNIISIPYSFRLEHLLSMGSEPSEYDVRFLISGRLEDFRNPMMGIECFAHLVKLYPAKKLLLVISGKGALEQDCIKLISHHQIEDKVQWLNSFTDWYDIHQIYSKADVLLSLQKHSGWGIIIQEAMASGLGIITSYNLAASNDLIINNYNGFFVQYNNKNAIIDKMDMYLNNDTVLKEHSRRSQDIVKTIDVRKTASEFIQFINYNTNKKSIL